MSDRELHRLLVRHEDYISSRLETRIDQSLDRTPGQNPLNTPGGRKRLVRWVGLLIDALVGGPAARDKFLEFQREIAYASAKKGLKLENALRYYLIFQQIVWELTTGKIPRGQKSKKRLRKGLGSLTQLYVLGSHALARSHLQIREERVQQTITYLEGLYAFSTDLMRLQTGSQIAELLPPTLVETFQARQCFLLIADQNRGGDAYVFPTAAARALKQLVGEVLSHHQACYIDPKGNRHQTPERSSRKHLLALPLEAHQRTYGAVGLLYAPEGFKFGLQEEAFLRQFIYAAVLALENSYGLAQLERSRQELRLLTGNIIDIQEKERRFLAADIHDTIAQTLTGIRYKVRACQVLAAQNSEKVGRQLADVSEMLQEAIAQCRALMSPLRPMLLDTMGIIAALTHFIKDFSRETGLEIAYVLPGALSVTDDLAICLFRITQEALRNVRKHARTQHARVQLEVHCAEVRLTVTDEGCGVDLKALDGGGGQLPPMGLLLMRERIGAMGGELRLKSAPGAGFRLTAFAPWKEPER